MFDLLKTEASLWDTVFIAGDKGYTSPKASQPKSLAQLWISVCLDDFIPVRLTLHADSTTVAHAWLSRPSVTVSVDLAKSIARSCWSSLAFFFILPADLLIFISSYSVCYEEQGRWLPLRCRRVKLMQEYLQWRYCCALKYENVIFFFDFKLTSLDFIHTFSKPDTFTIYLWFNRSKVKLSLPAL